MIADIRHINVLTQNIDICNDIYESSTCTKNGEHCWGERRDVVTLEIIDTIVNIHFELFKHTLKSYRWTHFSMEDLIIKMLNIIF